MREKNRKMSIKSVKMEISKNKKLRFFLMSEGSFNPKIRFLGQKACPVARGHTDRQTRKWLLWAPIQGFRNFSFRDQPINCEHKTSGFIYHNGITAWVLEMSCACDTCSVQSTFKMSAITSAIPLCWWCSWVCWDLCYSYRTHVLTLGHPLCLLLSMSLGNLQSDVWIVPFKFIISYHNS